jgi:hypothetical protein
MLLMLIGICFMSFGITTNPTPLEEVLGTFCYLGGLGLIIYSAYNFLKLIQR